MNEELGKNFAVTLRSATTMSQAAARSVPSLPADLRAAKTASLNTPMFPTAAAPVPAMASPVFVTAGGLLSSTSAMRAAAVPLKRKTGMGKTNRYTDRASYALLPTASTSTIAGAAIVRTGAFAGCDRSAAYAAAEARDAAEEASAAAGGAGVATSDDAAQSQQPQQPQAQAPRTLRRITQFPWSRVHLQQASTGPVAAPASPSASAEADQAAVTRALSALAAQVGDLNMRAWFKDTAKGASASVGGGSGARSLSRADLLAQVAVAGVELTPRQQGMLAELFFGGATRHSVAAAAAAAGEAGEDAGAGVGAGSGGNMDFLHLVSRLKTDTGAPADYKQYPARMAHLRGPAKVTRAAWPRHSAESALSLFRGHMEQRRVRATMRAMGVVDRVSYPKLLEAVGALSIALEDGEGEKLCALLDGEGKGWVEFGDMFPADTSTGANTTTSTGPGRVPIRHAAAESTFIENERLSASMRDAVPHALQRSNRFLTPAASAGETVADEVLRKRGGKRSDAPPALSRPTRYGLTYAATTNTSAHTITPYCGEQSSKYARAGGSGAGGSHFAYADDSEQYRPRAEAIALMQQEDRERRARRQEAHVANARAQAEAEVSRAAAAEADAERRREEKRLGTVGTRLRYYDSLDRRTRTMFLD